MTSDLLADKDIFHSPFHGIRDTARALPRIQKFLTVYDLIPLHEKHHQDLPRLLRTLSKVRFPDWLLAAARDLVFAN